MSNLTKIESWESASTDADVVVIGYGPVGMATAALLGRAGHRVVVLERYEGLFNLPRAAIFDDETMRTFASLGIAEQMLPKLHVQRSYEWTNAAGELLLEHDFAEVGRCGWAEWYMMYQPDLETALDETCQAISRVDVRFGSPVVAVGQDDSRTVVTVADGTTVTARFVVACDGGNSSTRRALGVGQDDYGFSEPWMVCDFRFRRPVEVPTARQVGDPERPTSIISLGPDHHRFSFMLDSEDDFGVECAPERVWPRVSRYLTPDDAELIRVATYTFRSLVAHDWRTGRVLLAGDAAHQMPPFLGQGMCSGIRDAQNIAFKLDLILRGRARIELLDTYQTEREPHVRAVIEKGIELGRMQTTRDPAAVAERDLRLRTQRASRQEAEKIRFPGLVEGMLAAVSTSDGRGELSVQGIVENGTQRGLFDQVVGDGFTLITTPEVLADLAEVLPALERAEVLVAAISATGPVRDVEGTYQRWFARHGWTAVVIRPDLYVYGAAGGHVSPLELVEDLLSTLSTPAQPTSLAV